ncbi:hypothetical protein A8709_23285 [Paenibacillus pectinilyticus]|uniref:HTH araC/xylS-type domain-containing protein n=1 Tax=Paenibacillus pectinilyticus TaxID=512399 RepID=A0A1C0ZRW6_9BACL|nr:helix-turn-helix domain-containing protein [Paenibacillus pectinilyticus]OCT10761.1 hypothetical protein A8709_23285 [Paenibacillus pectinilyticus]
MGQNINAPQRLFVKMVASITLLVVVVMMLLSFILYLNFEKIHSRQVSEANLNVLSQISYSANYMYENAKNFAVSLYVDEKNVPLMYSETENYDLVSAQIKYLNTLVEQSPFVHSVYVYNNKLDKYYSTWKSPINDAKSFFDQDIVNVVSEMKFSPETKFAPILRKIPVSLAGQTESNPSMDVISFILYDLPAMDNKIQGAIIININVDYLNQMIHSLSKKQISTISDIVILNQQGEIVTTTSPDYRLIDWSSKPYASIRQDQSGYMLQKMHDEKFMLSYATSDILNWRFISIVPYKLIVKDINTMKHITFLVCAILLAVGLSLAFILSRYLYAPVEVLFGKMKSLEKVNRETVYSKKMDVLRNLLSNRENDIAYLQRMFSSYHIPLEPGKSHQLFILSIDRFNDFTRVYNNGDQKSLKFAIGNAASEIACRKFTNVFVDIEADSIVILFEVGSDTYEYNRIQQYAIIRDIQQWTTDNLKLSLSAAISYVALDLSDISRSYLEAQTILKYRMFFGWGCILTPDSLAHIKADYFEPPVKLEVKLEEHLLYGRLEEAKEVLGEIHSYIGEYAYDTAMSYLFSFAYTLFKKNNELKANGNSRKLDIDYYSFTKELGSLETMEQIFVKFTELFAMICEVNNQSKNSRKSVIINSIVKIMESNYTDKALSHEGIANTLNLSRDYIGKLFRESYEMSIADYINEIRLNKAKELLEQDSRTVSDIMEAIGWENKNYFYKMFKLKFGVTTSEYRLHKVAEAAEKVDD